MSTNPTPPDPSGAAEVLAAPSPAAPEPPVVAAPPAPPAPPVLAAPPGPSEAERFYADFQDAQARPEAFLKHGRQYGIVPGGIESPDELARALTMYDEWKRGQAGAPPAGQDPPPPDEGFIDPVQFRQEIVQDTVAAVMQAQRQEAQQQQIAQEQQSRLGNLQSAVAAIAERENFKPEAHETLLRNVALGIDAAAERGAQVDFSPEALGQYADQVLAQLRGLATSAAMAEQQQQIGQHRRMAPLTSVPTGSPAAGPAAGGARGMAGVVARAQSQDAADRAGA